MEMYKKIIDDFDEIADTTPQKGGALFIGKENDEGVVIKHGNIKEIMASIVEIAIRDESTYNILSYALHLARVHKIIQSH